MAEVKFIALHKDHWVADSEAEAIAKGMPAQGSRGNYCVYRILPADGGDYAPFIKWLRANAQPAHLPGCGVSQERRCDCGLVDVVDACGLKDLVP